MNIHLLDCLGRLLYSNLNWMAGHDKKIGRGVLFIIQFLATCFLYIFILQPRYNYVQDEYKEFFSFYDNLQWCNWYFYFSLKRNTFSVSAVDSLYKKYQIYTFMVAVRFVTIIKIYQNLFFFLEECCCRVISILPISSTWPPRIYYTYVLFKKAIKILDKNTLIREDTKF